jgi:hypothetical protein
MLDSSNNSDFSSSSNGESSTTPTNSQLSASAPDGIQIQHLLDKIEQDASNMAHSIELVCYFKTYVILSRITTNNTVKTYG